MTRKLNIDIGYSDTKEGRPAGNSVYVAIASEVVNRRTVLLKNFVWADSLVFQIRHNAKPQTVKPHSNTPQHIHDNHN